MGCTSSIPKVYGVGRKKKMAIPQIVVFFPCTRTPVSIDLKRVLRGLIPRDLADRLAALRNQIILLATDTEGSAYIELQRTLSEYLSVVLGLTRTEYGLEELVEFKWRNLEDGRQETRLANSWFEVLLVIHMMAMLTLSEVNSLMTLKDQPVSSEWIISVDVKKMAVESLLKAAGYLEFCIRRVLIHLPQDIKKKLPKDLQEDVLEALVIQSLGQGTEIQLGLAVESQKATLSVKRRLACEQMSYFNQAYFCLSGCSSINDQYGKKHMSFIKWKYLEAKAAAYYYHGLILDKGNEPSCHISAVCCFLAAEQLLSDSKKACLSFCLAPPITRAPPPWGAMKHLHQKIPQIAFRKSQMYGYLLDKEMALQTLPDLPDFQLSLRADEYELPQMDPTWDSKWENQSQTLKQHLTCFEDEMEN